MIVNDGYTVGINEIYPSGTNSTMFTECCDTAICNDEKCCPGCGRNVIGFDAETDHRRGQIRWADATFNWAKE